MFKRAAIFALLLAISLGLFPLLAYASVLIGIPFLGTFLFFWPQAVLVPYGFYDEEIGHSQAFLMDSAILGAIVFWLICAVTFGYLFRNLKMRYAVLATYPVAVLVALLFYWVLYQFGYSVYLDGP